MWRTLPASARARRPDGLVVQGSSPLGCNASQGPWRLPEGPARSLCRPEADLEILKRCPRSGGIVSGGGGACQEAPNYNARAATVR